MWKPAKTAANDNDESDAASSSITVSGVTGRALDGVVRFLYSDTLPDFDANPRGDVKPAE